MINRPVGQVDRKAWGMSSILARGFGVWKEKNVMIVQGADVFWSTVHRFDYRT